MHYQGGYLTNAIPVITKAVHQHTAALVDPISDTTLRALNALGDTPWTPNRWQNDIVAQLYGMGIEVPGVVLGDDEPLMDRLPTSQWEALTSEQQGDYKAARIEVHTRNAQRLSRRSYLIECLGAAEDFATMPAIWYPHFLDFRTRLYPAATRGPHPQASDMGKSMIHFAHGKALGADGLYWLEIRAANCAGQDKLPWDQRIAWVSENAANIIACADDPIGMRGWWADVDEQGDPKFDEPWGFLVTCHELAQAWAMEDPAQFLSHLPIPLDGSCNGLQHLALLGHDAVAATATNLSADPERHDVYQEVADAVAELVSSDAIAGKPEAIHWAGNVKRKTVKRSVMTTPYGVTPLGIRDQLIADKHVNATEGGLKKGPLANYLRDQLVVVLRQKLPGPSAIMAWLQGVANILARNNLPMQWVTPADSHVQQSYYNLNKTVVNTLQISLELWDENPRGGINPSKASLSAAPNVVHSFDAAHMQLVICHLLDRGVRHFAMIHDSFGTHAADASLLAQAVRETLVSIYTEDHLSRLYRAFQAQAPDGVIIEPPPALGDFDVQQVLEAPFCFA